LYSGKLNLKKPEQIL